MMDRLCQYSTIILAGNVSVLLIVSIMTDYWEYRSFRAPAIQNALPASSNTTRLVIPHDTNSYFLIRYFWDPRASKENLDDVLAAGEWQYQPPALLYKYYHRDNVTSKVWAYNGTHNVTLNIRKELTRRYEDIVVLFVQYGNLFRDCDDLEVGARQRLGVGRFQSQRCFNFITSGRSNDFINRELPAVIHLERGAFLLASLCIISSVLSVVSGAYGSMKRDKRAVLTASATALISGMTLTIAIALFHGKCHLLHRREFMAGLDVPYKRTINDARVQHYGWSFVLAWVCVALCFIHTWVWLHKAQDMRSKGAMAVPASCSRQQMTLRIKYKDAGRNDELAILDR